LFELFKAGEGMKQFYYILQKGLFVIAFLTLCSTLAKAQTLTLGAVDAGPYTPGSSIAVPFTTSGDCIKPDNVYKLYISSVPNGTPIEIGSFRGHYTTFINGTIPTGLAPGSYNLTIKSSDAPATSDIKSINIIAGSAVVAKLTAPLPNTSYPDVFGNCSGNNNNNDRYFFTNTSTTGTTVTASIADEITHGNPVALPFNNAQSASFTAAKHNYTIFVKAVDNNGVEGTVAYQLINNQLSTNFGTRNGDPVCLSNGHGILSYTILPAGIDGNYPGNIYTVNWGDGTSTQYTLCDLILSQGNLSHDYNRPSCGTTSGTQNNSFQVDAQASNILCGQLGSPITSYARVVEKPVNNFTGPQSACLNVPVIFTNASNPGQNASNTGPNCQNNNALYTWVIDEGTANEVQLINYTLSTPFSYTFTTPGNHTITLKFQAQGNTVCGADDFSRTICVLAQPQPRFSLPNTTVCTGTTVIPNEYSITDQSCAANPLNNVYNWTVTGPVVPAFINNTTAASQHPQFTLSAPGIYTVTLSISTESCGAFTTSQTLIVNESPTVSLSPDKAFCDKSQPFTFDANAGPTQTLFTGTTADQPDTYTWTVSPNTYSFQNGTNAHSKYPQILFNDFTTYTVTATQTNNCGTDSKTQHLDFRPSPVVNAGPDQPICPTEVVHLNGTITGSYQSFNWTGGAGTFSDPNSLTSTYTPTNAEIASGRVVLTLHVVTGNPSPCDQIYDDVIITIYPENKGIDATKPICTGDPVNFPLTSSVAGSTFTWTFTATNVTVNMANGSGNINDVLTNTDGLNNGTVTYTITPMANNCQGTPFTLTVTVMPRPVLSVSPTTICSGQPAGLVFNSNLNPTTYKWTSVASAGITGNSNQTTATSFTGINEVLTNGSNSAAGSVTYTITPVSSAGCEGSPVTVTVNVLPLPVVANAGADEALCTANSYTLNGNNPGISTGMWTFIPASGQNQSDISFVNANQYNTVVNGLQPGKIYTFRWMITGAAPCNATFDDVSINNLSPLTNNISFGAPAVCYGQTITVTGDQPTGGNGTYIYSWQSSADGSTNSWTTISGASGQNYSFTGTESIYIKRLISSLPCSSESQPVHIVVQRAITINTISADQVICYNNTPVILNGSTPDGGDGNFSYQWQSSVDDGANWNTISGATDINYQPVALTVTTKFRRIVTTALCTDDQKSTSNLVTITVNPQNTNTITSDANRTICTGASFIYHITARDANTSFTWVSSVSSGTVTGNTASGSGDINDRLTNSDLNDNGTVTYTITPINIVNNISCPGVPFVVTVTVTPLPIITVNRASNTICSGSQTDISFGSNLNGTQFKWLTTATGGISGNQNQVTPVSVLRIDQTLINNTTTNGTVTYTITPVSASGCEGAPVTVTITVQPPPLQAVAGNDEQICAASTYTLNGNNPAPFAGLWTITSTQQGVVFADATKYNTVVSGLQPGQNYTFHWTISSAGLCAPSTDDVVISNLQGLTNNISFGAPAICYGQTATVLGDQPAGGTGSFVYRWESSIDGSTNNWTIIPGQTNQNYTFTGTESVYIRRVVLSTPCSSFSNPVHVIVQPAISNNNITANQLICYDNTPALLNGSTPIGADGNYFFQWQKSVDNGISWTNVGSAINSYQPDALIVTTQFRRIITSAICSGDQKSISNTVTITVNALNTNVLTSDASRIICTGTPFSYHPTAQQSGTSFTYTSSATVNISRDIVNGSGDINDVLVNTDLNQNGQVTYIITPINNGCPGTPFTLTVTVTPIPRITLTNTGKAICSGNPTGITFTTNTPDVLVKWTTDNVQGITGNKNQFPAIATRIDDILSSELTTAATIVYHITPVSPGGCEGPTVDATVTVLPQPVPANAGPDEQVCSTNNYTFKGNDPAPSTGKWTLTSGQLGIGFENASKYNTTVNGLQAGQNYTFRWTITSPGNCNSSADEVVINDLNSLTNTISYANPAVCYGQTITVTGQQPTGGTGSFVYSWESSADNITWTAVSGQSNADFSFTGTQSIYVRRIVNSGPCSSSSQPVFITVQQPISNNTVASDQEVCYNNAPKLLTGSTPAGADSRYLYQWQSSTDNGTTWTNIQGASTVDYQVNNLTVTTVFRRVVTSALCTGPQQSISNIINIMVNPLANATYTYTSDLGCIPFVINAQNIKATAAAGNNTYTWYADGVFIGSGFAFPGYTIQADDAHVVIKLVATSKYGCLDASFTHTFSTIKEVTAGFTQNQTKGCGPLTVNFSNTSAPQNAATYTWNFGNGSTSTLANPNPVTFLPRPDGKDTTYTVTLKALTACGIRTATSTVTVRPKPTSIFTPDKTIGCSPLTVNFNNTSPGTNNTYTYDFGDGQTLVTTDNQAVNHTYTALANKVFTVKMTAQNECGTSVTQYNIRISPNTVLPQLVVNGDQKAGCAPWTVQFHNNTKGGTYFTYDFGDGTTLSSLNAPEVVSHTFLKDGIFNVKMTATNGCSDTSVYQAITVYPQPLTNFTSDVQTGCTQLTVNFTNKTPGNNTYVWDFGDGSTSSAANPTHIFAARNTPFTISLIARNLLNCPDTMVLKNYIKVNIPPKAAFMARPDSVIVYPHYSFSFADKSTNTPILWKWSFGDGSNSGKQNPEHTYRDTGLYKVKLVVYSLQGCADSITHTVQITGVPGQLFVPNAFMPTSRFSEVVTFKAKGSGIKRWRMRVFNKWGQVIWESTKLTERGEPAEGWDGMMNGAPAPQGVYVWQIEATYLNGNDWEGMRYKGSAPSRTGVIHLIQ